MINPNITKNVLLTNALAATIFEISVIYILRKPERQTMS